MLFVNGVDKYNLPRKAREIKQISEQEWIKI